MILLLDAHAVLWWLADDPTLHPDARVAIASPDADVLVSAGTIWEIEIKRSLGKVTSPPGLVRCSRRRSSRSSRSRARTRSAPPPSLRDTAIRSIECSWRRPRGSGR